MKSGRGSRDERWLLCLTDEIPSLRSAMPMILNGIKRGAYILSRHHASKSRKNSPDVNTGGGNSRRQIAQGGWGARPISGSARTLPACPETYPFGGLGQRFVKRPEHGVLPGGNGEV